MKKENSLPVVWLGILVVVVMVIWMSLPLLQNSPADMVVVPQKSSGKSVNLNTLGLNPESGAPGAPLTGELIDNPATAPGTAPASLYSGNKEGVYFSEEDLKNSQRTATDSAAVGTRHQTPSYAGVSPAPRGKLNMVPSMTGGSAGTTATGKIAGNTPFFGKAGADAVIDTKSLFQSAADKIQDKSKSPTLASLLSSERASQNALSTGFEDAAKSGATKGFEAMKQDASLSGQDEMSAATGLNYDGTAADLKKNDPSLSKKVFKQPKVPDPKLEPQKMDWGEFVMKMILTGIMGNIFKGTSNLFPT